VCGLESFFFMMEAKEHEGYSRTVRTKLPNQQRHNAPAILLMGNAERSPGCNDRFRNPLRVLWPLWPLQYEFVSIKGHGGIG